MPQTQLQTLINFQNWSITAEKFVQASLRRQLNRFAHFSAQQVMHSFPVSLHGDLLTSKERESRSKASKMLWRKEFGVRIWRRRRRKRDFIT